MFAELTGVSKVHPKNSTKLNHQYQEISAIKTSQTITQTMN
jgi:hypothetical protein